MSSIPYLNEHQAFPKDDRRSDNGDGDHYYPDDEEKAKVKMVNKLLEEAKTRREKFDDKWIDYYKFFRGQQWKEKRPSYRHSEVINLIFETIQSQVPVMTDSRPKLEFLPTEPSDREFASIINQVTENDWIRKNWGHTLLEVLYDAHIFGTGLSGMKFDPQENRGIGDIVYESVDPFCCYPDPDSKDVNRGGSYFIYAEPKSLKYIKSKFKKGKYVRADIGDYSTFDRADIGDTKFRSPTDSSIYVEGGGSKPDKGNKALLVYCYIFKCEETVSESKIEKNAEGIEEEIQDVRLKYPNGRCIVKAGDIILKDEPIEYDDGLAPYSRLQNYINPRQFWGISEIEQLEGPQKIFNKLVSFALDVLTLMGNPIWIISSDSGIDDENLINRPGLCIQKEPGSEVRREEGVQLQPYVLQLIDRMKVWVDDMSGRTDVSRGVRPEGVNSGIAISQLQEAAQTRMRQKSRNLDYYLQDVGQQYLSRILQFNATPQVYRMTANPDAEKYFKFHIEKTKNETGEDKTYGRMRPIEKGEDGQYYHGEEQTMELKGQLDCRVTTGSTLPFNKAEKESRAYKLFELGIIDDEEVMKMIDYPNYQAVLDRVNEKKMAMAEQEAAAKAGPQPAQV